MQKVPSVGFALDATAEVPNRVGRASSVKAPMQNELANRLGMPFKEFIGHLSKELQAVLRALSSCFKLVTQRLRHGLRTPSGLDAAVEPTRVGAAGDVGRLDQLIGNVLVEALSKTGVCCAVALETHEGVIGLPTDDAANERFALVLDPLDGVNNADAGVSVGTIWGIYRCSVESMAQPVFQHLLRPGDELVAAGYAMVWRRSLDQPLLRGTCYCGLSRTPTARVAVRRGHADGAQLR